MDFICLNNPEKLSTTRCSGTRWKEMCGLQSRLHQCRIPTLYITKLPRSVTFSVLLPKTEGPKGILDIISPCAVDLEHNTFTLGLVFRLNVAEPQDDCSGQLHLVDTPRRKRWGVTRPTSIRANAHRPHTYGWILKKEYFHGKRILSHYTS